MCFPFSKNFNKISVDSLNSDIWYFIGTNEHFHNLDDEF